MCGRFFLTPKLDELLALLHAAPEGLVEVRTPWWNVAPTTTLLVLRRPEAGAPDRGTRRVLAPARWGLVPGWWKDPEKLPVFHNACAETAASKPVFRAAVRYRRVVVPVSGFYEWEQTPAKQPFAVRADHGGLLLLAGLGSVYERGPAVLETAAVLTVDAGAAMGGIHPRMPAVLDADEVDRWLDAQPDEAMALVRPRDEGLTLTPVGRGVNNARNHDGSWFDAA